MSNEIDIVKIKATEGRVSGSSFWNSQVELLTDEGIIQLLNSLSDMIKNVNTMLALRLRDMSHRRIDKIDKMDNPELINMNFRILVDRINQQDKQIKALLERNKQDDN